jgi:hypothetical protein
MFGLLYAWIMVWTVVCANTEMLSFTVDRQSAVAWKVSGIEAVLTAPVTTSWNRTLQHVLHRDWVRNEERHVGYEHWYLLDGLETGTSYTCRVSYAATTPTDFYLTVHDEADARPHLEAGLLEEAVDLPSGQNRRFLRVRAVATGIPVEHNAPVPSTVVYQLTLEKLYLNVLPNQVPALTVVLLLVTLISWLVVVPTVEALLPKLKTA